MGIPEFRGRLTRSELLTLSLVWNRLDLSLHSPVNNSSWVLLLPFSEVRYDLIRVVVMRSRIGISVSPHFGDDLIPAHLPSPPRAVPKGCKSPDRRIRRLHIWTEQLVWLPRCQVAHYRRFNVYAFHNESMLQAFLGSCKTGVLRLSQRLHFLQSNSIL